MAFRIQLRRDTAANWTTVNPILASGEVGFETDTKNEKVGDGITAWNTLGYRASLSIDLDTHAATSKTTPADADEIPLVDSATTFTLKKLTWANLKATLLSTWKDTSGGLVGLTLFKINFKNAANTFTNFLTNATTAARTWTFPDKDGTVALLSDLVVNFDFSKLDSGTVAFTKTAAGTISVKAGTKIKVAEVAVNISVTTAVVMPALTGGTDYAIYACTDGTIRADASFTAPTGYTTANSRMIGGFHYGLVAPGTTVAGGSFATTGTGMIWTQADVDAIAGINAFSLWDLKFRPLCDPKGMALVSGKTWVDIYLCGTDHTTNGTSKAGTNIASGTVLPKKPLEFGGNGTTTYAQMNWWDSLEIANAYKKRLIREQEFVLAAFGVTENQTIDATAATYPTTQRNAGYTSKYGLEQASGHHWTWGEDGSFKPDGTAGWAWNNVNGGRGQLFLQNTLGLVLVILGGSRTSGVYSGSRCASWYACPWGSDWRTGLRAAADHQVVV